MPRFSPGSSAKQGRFVIPTVAALGIFGWIASGAIAPRAEARPERGDSVTVHSHGAPGGRVKISIDESGISIEGKADVDAGDSTGGWVNVHDARERFKEKGLDIVKFGKSVFVARDELVRGDLVVFGGNAIVEGRVMGDVVVIGGDIRAREGCEIKGDAVVIGGALEEDGDVSISGERVMFHRFFPSFGMGGAWAGTRWLKFAFQPVSVFVKLVLAFLVLLFMRGRIVRADGTLSSGWLRSFGFGLLVAFTGFFAVLIVVFALVITIIGIPLALLLIVSCAGMLIFSWTLFAFSLGRMLSRRLQIQSINPYLHVLLGAIILSLPGIISSGLDLVSLSVLKPLSVAVGIGGVLLGAFAYLGGLGGLLLSRFGSRMAGPPVAGSPAEGGAAPTAS